MSLNLWTLAAIGGFLIAISIYAAHRELYLARVKASLFESVFVEWVKENDGNGLYLSYRDGHVYGSDGTIDYEVRPRGH